MIGVQLPISTHIFTGVPQDSDYIIEVIAINGIGGNATMKFLKGIIIMYQCFIVIVYIL